MKETDGIAWVLLEGVCDVVTGTTVVKLVSFKDDRPEFAKLVSNGNVETAAQCVIWVVTVPALTEATSLAFIFTVLFANVSGTTPEFPAVMLTLAAFAWDPALLVL